MPRDMDRRTFMKAAGAAAGVAALGPGIAWAEQSEDRYIIDVDDVSVSELEGMEIIHDLSEEIGWVVARGSEADIPSAAEYAEDFEFGYEVPMEAEQTLSRDEVDDAMHLLSWDKMDQDISRAHTMETGDGARVGIVDSGVYPFHPDLNDQFRRDLSANYTTDGYWPGPVPDLAGGNPENHGTHVAGTVAANDNGVGIRGHAPDAELVSLRVFSGTGAGGDTPASVVYGATPVSEGGAGCDVLNLSLGFPPLLPVGAEAPPVGGPVLMVDQATVDTLGAYWEDAALYARDQGTLVVASAGNSGLDVDRNLNESYDRGDGVDYQDASYREREWNNYYEEDVIILPSELDGYMTVSATGPIGYGWPPHSGDDTVTFGNGGSVAMEFPPRVELPTYEPSFFTNYGRESTSVSAPGGNADIDAASFGPSNWYLDLVASTVVEIADTAPDTLPSPPLTDAEWKEIFQPAYGWKAGTSMSAPQVSGLAALLYAQMGNPTPGKVQSIIEKTAKQRRVGLGGETAAPGEHYVAFDFTFNGNSLSNPGANDSIAPSEVYRGHGHIDTVAALLDPQARNGGGNRGDEPVGDDPVGDGPIGDAPVGEGGGDGGGGGGGGDAPSGDGY